MTIKYTYPEQKPIRASVNDSYYMAARTYGNDVGAIELGNGYRILTGDVPEICEAMMKLAGHEWPDSRLREAGERIIEQLKNNRGMGETPFVKGVTKGLNVAINIVHYECGLD